jgi:TolB-like protein/Flp pilus assembly protein TadD
MTDDLQQGLLHSLRRRKVVQWGLAYAAGAWALLQVISHVVTTFHWPEQLQQIATLLLFLGLPVVLVLAWYHGDRGQQRITTPELGMLTLVLLLGGGALWYFQRTSETTAVTSPPPPASAAVFATDASIAVLPFVNVSADKKQEYFADGISEELLNLLAQVPELRVIARTSSFSFKGKDVDIAEIARRLNVANVLEGSVRKSGETLRITAQLVRASDSSHLWSQTYDRQMTDVFKVQDEIAAAVVNELKIKLLGATPTSTVTDPEVYSLYLHAREIRRLATPRSFDQSIALLRQALALDPTYTAAWAGLAGAYINRALYGGPLHEESADLARAAANRALALDSRYAPAYAWLGSVAMYFDGDLAAAAGHFERALALEPANPEIIGEAAVLARRLGRLDEAIALGEYQMTRDPANADGHMTFAYSYRYAGRLNEALTEFRTALDLSPALIGGHSSIGEVLLQKGDPRAALAEFEQDGDTASRLIGLAMAYQSLARKVESDAALAKLIERYGNKWPVSVAYVHAFRGEADPAFEWLEKAIQSDDPSLSTIAIYPMFANIHTDPRWLPFLRKHGMAPEQLAGIKFDVKVPN